VLELVVAGAPLSEHSVSDGSKVVLATAGAAFEVRLLNDNRADYLVRIFVDGLEVDPGYLKRLRGCGCSSLRGFVCRGAIHEFLFAKTPVDETVSSGSTSSRSSIGEVKATVFATRRVRLDSSSSDDDERNTRSSAGLGVRPLPEKVAIKEHGVQARAGGQIESVPRYRRRRRGDYRLEKTEEVVTLRLLYRDSFWFARNDIASEIAPAVGPAPHSQGRSQAPAPMPSRSDVKCESGRKVQASGGGADQLWPMSAKVSARRVPGETRAPDGKRRRGRLPAEVIELSD